MIQPPAWRVIAWMCAAHVASMTGFAAYSTLLPRLQEEWGLNNSQAGFISGAFFAGYMAAVPLLTSLTDRVDARRVYLAGRPGAKEEILRAAGVQSFIHDGCDVLATLQAAYDILR